MNLYKVQNTLDNSFTLTSTWIVKKTKVTRLTFEFKNESESEDFLDTLSNLVNSELEYREECQNALETENYLNEEPSFKESSFKEPSNEPSNEECDLAADKYERDLQKQFNQ